MNYTTVKKLHGIALLLQFLTLPLILLMTIGQKTVRLLVLASSDLNDIITIPVAALISVIPVLILFAISYFLMKKNNGSNSKTHVIVCITVAIVLQVLTPYINSLCLQVYASLRGVGYFSAYSALLSVINYVISPIQLVAFSLFCLSLGGYYGMEGKEE